MRTSLLSRLFAGFIAALFLCCLAVFEAIADESATPRYPGLLVIAHGAPQAEWNKPVERLVDRVRALNLKRGQFQAVEIAFLEFAQPDAVSGIAALESAGCDHIIVVPLFIAPSSHSHYDLPAVLGLYSTPEIVQLLADEGASIAQPHVPITITHTMDEGNLLSEFAAEQARNLSTDPHDEALVLLLHGCPDHQRLVDQASLRALTFACGQCGIDYGDWAYCAVGQTYLEEALPALIRAAEAKPKVLVVGMYVSSNASNIHHRAMDIHGEDKHAISINNTLAGTKLRFCQKGLVDFTPTADWILDSALAALPKQ